MAIYTVTYAKKSNGKTETMCQEIEAKSPSAAKRKVRDALEKELYVCFEKHKAENPEKAFSFEFSPKVLGVWQIAPSEKQSPLEKHIAFKKVKPILKYYDFSVSEKE